VRERLETDRRVAAVIESSLVYGLLDRALGSVWRAASTSVAAAKAAELASAWIGLDTSVRRFAVGTMLIVAVVTHIAFVLVTQVPAGWLWVVLPGIFGAIGLLLVAAPGLPKVSKR